MNRQAAAPATPVENLRKFTHAATNCGTERLVEILKSVIAMKVETFRREIAGNSQHAIRFRENVIRSAAAIIKWEIAVSGRFSCQPIKTAKHKFISPRVRCRVESHAAVVATLASI